jgi:hypothetical protein
MGLSGQRIKVAKSTEELLKRIKDLNPGPHTEHWRILDKQPGPKGQRLILLIDRDYHIAIKETRYRILQDSVKELLRS